MDEQLTLHELRRLEAERKLRTIPQVILETVWVRDAQIEAVIDAVLAVTLGADTKAYAHARHVGQWCARIAEELPYGPDPSLARRVGVLADVDPAALERIDELKGYAPFVRDYQAAVMESAEVFRMVTTIVAVAVEFDARLSGDADGRSPTPGSTLRSMVASASAASRAVVDALCRATHSTVGAGVETIAL